MFNSKGAYLAGWGSFGSAPGQFKKPEDIAVDNKGRVYVADTGNSRIEIFEMVN